MRTYCVNKLKKQNTTLPKSELEKRCATGTQATSVLAAAAGVSAEVQTSYEES